MIMKIGMLLFFVLNIGLFANNDNSKVYMSFVGMNMDYEEYNNDGKLVDSERSLYTEMLGIEVNLEKQFNKNMKSYSTISYNIMLLDGMTEYKGSYLNDDLPYGSVVGNTINMILDTDISYKYINTFSMFSLLYGFGIGYHYWDRTLSKTQTEIYTWYFLKPVIGVGYNVSKNINLAINIEYLHGFNTLMSITNPKLDFVLGGVDIFNISIPITYKYSKSLDVFFETIFQKQTIYKSNIKYYNNSGYYEPDSTSYDNYIKLGIAFKF